MNYVPRVGDKVRITEIYCNKVAKVGDIITVYKVGPSANGWYYINDTELKVEYYNEIPAVLPLTLPKVTKTLSKEKVGVKHYTQATAKSELVLRGTEYCGMFEGISFESFVLAKYIDWASVSLQKIEDEEVKMRDKCTGITEEALEYLRKHTEDNWKLGFDQAFSESKAVCLCKNCGQKMAVREDSSQYCSADCLAMGFKNYHKKQENSVIKRHMNYEHDARFAYFRSQSTEGGSVNFMVWKNGQTGIAAGLIKIKPAPKKPELKHPWDCDDVDDLYVS